MAPPVDVEKPSTFLHETNSKGSDAYDDVEFTPEERRRIIHRVDRRLVTMVGFMYCVSLMDRTNLSNAAIAGMVMDLAMHVGFRYSTVALVFFTTYVVFQPPSTVIVRAIGPRIHLSAITFGWGCIMIGMGFVKTWQSMAGLRVVLGLFEAGFFPSCVYLLSTWYTRYEVGKRYSLFYILGCVASAFSGILAYGLMHMNGLGDQAGWRWIFILEGIITCGIATIGYVFLVGFPDDAHKNWNFLSERETRFIIARVNADRGDATTAPFNLRLFLRAGLDPKIWGFALIFFGSTTMAYAIAYFLPIILNEELGYSVGASQCLIAPPYAFAGIVIFAAGWFGDKYHVRGPIIVFNMVLGLIGLPILGWSHNNAARYFGVFLLTAAANVNVPTTMAYQANNIRGQWKRAFCSATLVGMGGVGGIAGTLVFRSQDKPTYRPGLWACIACCLMNILIVGLLSIKFKRDNRKADRGELAIEDSEEDHQGGFRYTY